MIALFLHLEYICFVHQEKIDYRSMAKNNNKQIITKDVMNTDNEGSSIIFLTICKCIGR